MQQNANGLAVEVELPDVPVDVLPAREAHAPVRKRLDLMARGLLRLGAALEKLAEADLKSA